MNRQRKEKVVEIDQHRLIQKGTPSDIGAERHYETFLDKRRDKILARVEEGYQEWKRTKTYAVPQSLPNWRRWTLDAKERDTFI